MEPSNFYQEQLMPCLNAGCYSGKYHQRETLFSIFKIFVQFVPLSCRKNSRAVIYKNGPNRRPSIPTYPILMERKPSRIRKMRLQNLVQFWLKNRMVKLLALIRLHHILEGALKRDSVFEGNCWKLLIQLTLEELTSLFRTSLSQQSYIRKYAYIICEIFLICFEKLLLRLVSKDQTYQLSFVGEQIVAWKW